MKLSVYTLAAVCLFLTAIRIQPVCAQPFIPSEQVVADSALDPEFDAIGKQVAFAQRRPGDYNRLSIFVAPVDTDGSFDLDRREFIGHSVPIWPEDTTPSNGPEWMYTAGDSELVWTGWKHDNPGSGIWVIKHARKEAGRWVTRTVPCTDYRHSPKGSLNEGDPKPFIRYFAGILDYPRRAVYLRRKFTCGIETVLPGTEEFRVANIQASIVPGLFALVYPLFDPATQRLQVMLYNDQTQHTEWLTSSETHKTVALSWIAPDLNNKYAFLTLEAEVNSTCPDYRFAPYQALICHDWDRLGIYLKEGDTTTKLYELSSPNPQLPLIASPELFVFQGQSYISVFVFHRIETQRQVWIMSIDGGFQRRVDEDRPLLGMPRDPEPYVTDDTVWIYLNRGTKVFRAETGLGQ